MGVWVLFELSSYYFMRECMRIMRQKGEFCAVEESWREQHTELLATATSTDDATDNDHVPD
jgi:hypothetical protein